MSEQASSVPAAPSNGETVPVTINTINVLGSPSVSSPILGSLISDDTSKRYLTLERFPLMHLLRQAPSALISLSKFLVRALSARFTFVTGTVFFPRP
jgi:hypothetical protein